MPEGKSSPERSGVISIETQSVPEIIEQLPLKEALRILENIDAAAFRLRHDFASFGKYLRAKQTFDREIRDSFPTFSRRVAELDACAQGTSNLQPEFQCALVTILEEEMEEVTGRKFDDRVSHLESLVEKIEDSDGPLRREPLWDAEIKKLPLKNLVQSLRAPTLDAIRKEPGFYRAVLDLFPHEYEDT